MEDTCKERMNTVVRALPYNVHFSRMPGRRLNTSFCRNIITEINRWNRMRLDWVGLKKHWEGGVMKIVKNDVERIL